MPSTHSRPRIAALLTAYHPDERLTAVVESALADCEQVVIADNTPGGAPDLAGRFDPPTVTVLTIGNNVGLGAALNRAKRELRDGIEAVLILDQDSVLPDGLVRGLFEHLADPSVGVAAPTPWDAAHGGHYSALAGLHTTKSEQRAVITSGMLVRRALLDRIEFREELFNDFVDIAFCVDVRDAGARILQDWRLKLPHSMGDRREHRLGPLTVRVIHYPPWRHYWIARNGFVMNRREVRRHPQAILSTVFFVTRKIVTTGLFQPARRRQIPALLRGARDGLLNRFSPRYLPPGSLFLGVHADKPAR